MKTKTCWALLGISLLLTLAPSASAVDPVPAKLVWDPNPLSSPVISYTVYELVGPGWNLLGTVPVEGPLEWPVVLDGLPHTFGVTGRNGFFESDRSTVDVPVVPLNPSGLRLVVP